MIVTDEDLLEIDRSLAKSAPECQLDDVGQLSTATVVLFL